LGWHIVETREFSQKSRAFLKSVYIVHRSFHLVGAGGNAPSKLGAVGILAVEH
jgi:hypothetical protein